MVTFLYNSKIVAYFRIKNVSANENRQVRYTRFRETNIMKEQHCNFLRLFSFAVQPTLPSFIASNFLKREGLRKMRSATEDSNKTYYGRYINSAVYLSICTI